MSYIPKLIRIDAIPPELCTRREAAEILGLKCYENVHHNHKRFKNLRFTTVSLNGQKTTLFNRKEVEALRYKPAPEGYLTTRQAGDIIGFPSGANFTTIYSFLKRRKVTQAVVQAHHNYYVWKRKEVEKLRGIKTPQS